MMDILKKVTKASLFMIFSVFILVGCSSSKKSLMEEDFRNIKFGMDEKEVKRNLGEPDKVFNDSKDIEEALQYDSDTSSDRWDIENPNMYKEFYGSDKKMQESFNQLDKKNDIICFRYNYQRDRNSKKNRIWHIYFYNGKVIGMFFP